MPPRGVALLGANAQGKTNLLEAVYYPVLFRSFRGAPDQEVAAFGATGFHVEARVEDADVGTLSVGYLPAGRRKRILLDGAEPERLTEAVGRWLAVVFLPDDVELASGPAALRRQYLDRLLSLADRGYLRALARYRAALAQRNSALRQGRPELAWAFDAPLAAAGAEIVAARERWARQRRPSGSPPSSTASASASSAALTLPRVAGAGRPRRVDPGAGRRPAADRARGAYHGRAAPGRPRARDRRAADPGVRLAPGSSAAPRWRSSCSSSRRCARRAGPSPRCCWTTCSPSWTTSAGSGSRPG